MNTPLDLPASRPFPATRAAAARRTLEEAISSGPRRIWWRTPAVLSGAVASVVLTAGVGVAYVAFAPATDHSRVRCYSTAALGSGSSFKGSDISAASSDTNPTPTIAPVDACGAMWRAGIVQPDGGHGYDPAAAEHSVPALVACVLKGGVAGVFPGDAGTCAKLGLPALS
jgi:hypothetical protein